MYGFIGAGNMAGAIIKGVVKSKAIEPQEIIIYDINYENSEKLAKELGIGRAMSNLELIEKSDCIILCVKPNVLPNLISEYKEIIKEKNPLIISIAAGVSIKSMENILSNDKRLIRVMPNINADVGEAMSCICYNEQIKDSDKDIAKKIFESIGKICELDENYIAVFSGIAGCSPAFTFMFIESLAKAAHKNGINKSMAIKIAAQAVYGSAKKILESDEHPNALADKVCSPGGTTIEGVCKLDELAFSSAIVQAVEATIQKDAKLM